MYSCLSGLTTTESTDYSQSSWRTDHEPYGQESIQIDNDTRYKRTGSDAFGLLYSEHIPTSLFQKTLLSAGAAAVAISDPARGGTVQYGNGQPGSTTH